MSVHDLLLLPRDGLFLKDGREWASSDAGRAHSRDWPAPSTLRGALCTARGRAIQHNGKLLDRDGWLELAKCTRVKAMLAVRRRLYNADWTADDRVWPAPADALFLETDTRDVKALQRLDPVPAKYSVLGRPDGCAATALWWPHVAEAAKPASAEPWWLETALLDWLANPQAWAKPQLAGDAFPRIELPRHVQAHVGISTETYAAREQILFAHDVVETIQSKHDEQFEWAIACRAELGDTRPDLLTLGGDRRLVMVQKAEAGVFACPKPLLDAFRKEKPRGLRLMAVSPANFKQGWLPDGFSASDGGYRGNLLSASGEMCLSRIVLRAALVQRATHVSGWDMVEREAKSTTRLAPPGTVYHLEKADQSPFTDEEATRLWLVALGNRTDDGYGRFIPGIWHPQGSAQ